MQESQVTMRRRALEIIKILRQATQGMEKTASARIIERYGRDPFLILISCLLSLRTRDTVTYPASCALFEVAATPQEIVSLPLARLESLIHTVGFYKNKARTLKNVSKTLIERFGGHVPRTMEELVSITGIGPKTANLVLSDAFGIPAICVDTHVHRISNRLGLVKTKTPEETQKALEKLLPKRYWSEFGPLLVRWGQNICVPISPKCSQCAIAPLCPRVGVTNSR